MKFLERFHSGLEVATFFEMAALDQPFAQGGRRGLRHLRPPALCLLPDQIVEGFLKRRIFRVRRAYGLDKFFGIINSRRDGRHEIGRLATRLEMVVTVLAANRHVLAKFQEPGGEAHIEFGKLFETLGRLLVDLLDRLPQLLERLGVVVAWIEAMLSSGIQNRDGLDAVSGRAPHIDPRRRVLALCVERAHICPHRRLNFGKRLASDELLD